VISPVIDNVVPSNVAFASALSSPAFPVAVVILLFALLRIFAEPDVPLEPLEPDVPDEPDVPLVPELPEVPLVPEEPEVPDVPDEP
jgi:hypothetical protein